MAAGLLYGQVKKTYCTVFYPRECDDRAAALFAESLRLFEERGNRRGIAECLLGLAAVTITQGQHPADATRAARLLGAAEAQFWAIGAALWPADQRQHARTVAAVQAALNEEACAAAWEQGRAMTLDESVAAALAGR